MKLNTMEEQNPGKFYKDKLKEYESPFDLDTMFDKIEPQINPERKRRPMPFWFWGCGGLVGLLGLLSLILYIYPIDSFTTKSNNPETSIAENHLAISSENVEKDDLDIHEIQATENEIQEEEITSNQQQIALNKKQTVTLNVNPISEISIIQSNTVRTRNNSSNEANKNSVDLVSNINTTQSGIQKSLKEETGLIKTKDVISIENLPFLDFIVRHQSSTVTLPFGIKKRKPLDSASDHNKWSFSLGGGYLMIDKTHSFNLDSEKAWYDNYKSNDEIYPGYYLQAELERKISNSFSILGSIGHNSWQERNSFTFSNSTITIDNTLPDTIVVDRDLAPIDTIFGQERLEINTSNSSLVSSYSLTSLGLGMELNLNLTKKLSLSPRAQLIASYMRSKGNTTDNLGNLVDRSQFTLNGNKVYSNKMIYGASIGVNLVYNITDHFNVDINSSYLYNFNSFTNGDSLIEKRNLLRIGLGCNWNF